MLEPFFYKQLKRLPRRPNEVWQGGLFRLPSWIANENGEPYRPFVPVWLAVQAHKLHVGEPMRAEDRSPPAALAALIEFAQDGQVGGYRPGRVEVINADLPEFLAAQLAPIDIEVQHVDRLPAVEQALEDFCDQIGAPKRRRLPGALSGQGVTSERMWCFAEAAARFYRAGPWQYLTDVDLIKVEQPAPPAGMDCAVILGAAGTTFGLALFGSARAFYDFYSRVEASIARPAVKSPLWYVTFEAITGMPLSDADLWEDENLAVAGGRAYPLAIRYVDGERVARPTADELAFLEGLLRSLAETEEGMIDAGRWSRQVTTAAGTATFQLAIPDLLEPPTPQEWFKRGFVPDHGVQERMFADMDRYFDKHPPATIDDYNATLARVFSGRRTDELVTEPETPLEKAQDLCYQAFDTFGRRRVQLARQALEICQDCADAHVLLAEQSGSPEVAHEHFVRGVAAGERALGQESFDRDVGRFWGITDTRPYMRARLGLAQCLSRLGQHEEVAEHYQDLLRLNPNDNQGVRYFLMPLLLEAGRDVEAARLLEQFKESSANWAFARALLAFRLSGRSLAARRELRAATRINPHVLPMLLDTGPLPQADSYQIGSPEEAAFCADELRPAFAATAGAMDWLTAEAQRTIDVARQRGREHQRAEHRKRKERKRRKRR